MLAYHCQEAASPKGDRFLEEVPIEAMVDVAGVEAQAQVERAMALLPRVTAGATRQQLEGRLQFALGDALTMTKGFASPEVMTALSRARRLLDETDHESIRALGGLFNYHLIRSESPRCLELAAPFLKRRLDRPTENVIHYLVGTAHLHLGNFRKSIGHLETALSLYDEEDCRPVAFVAGIHLHSFTLIWLGLGYLYIGSLKRAAETISAAVKDARSRSHPFTLVSALLALARFLNHTHELKGAIEATEEGLAIATEQRSPYHLSRANVLRAVNLVDSGRVEEGITLMEHALIAHRKTGANFQSSYNLSRLAEAHARAGESSAARACRSGGGRGRSCWRALVGSRSGAFARRSCCWLVRRSATKPSAASRKRSHVRATGAMFWELRAAQSLASLWQAQGRDDQARDC